MPNLNLVFTIIFIPMLFLYILYHIYRIMELNNDINLAITNNKQ
jgi:hypothetical protein